MQTVRENPLLEAKSDKDLADQLADFFIRKIKTIRDDLAKFMQYEPEQREVPIMELFKHITSKMVGKIIMEHASKSYELDVVSTKLIKEGLLYFVDTITIIVYHSLKTGFFPQVWKTAIVRSLGKTSNQILFTNCTGQSAMSLFCPRSWNVQY